MKRGSCRQQRTARLSNRKGFLSSSLPAQHSSKFTPLFLLPHFSQSCSPLLFKHLLPSFWINALPACDLSNKQEWFTMPSWLLSSHTEISTDLPHLYLGGGQCREVGAHLPSTYALPSVSLSAPSSLQKTHCNCYTHPREGKPIAINLPFLVDFENVLLKL